MKSLQEVPWELRHEDEIWTSEEDSRYVATFENFDYPDNSSVCQHVVDMHNAQISMIENSIGYADI